MEKVDIPVVPQQFSAEPNKYVAATIGLFRWKGGHRHHAGNVCSYDEVI